MWVSQKYVFSLSADDGLYLVFAIRLYIIGVSIKFSWDKIVCFLVILNETYFYIREAACSLVLLQKRLAKCR